MGADVNKQSVDDLVVKKTLDLTGAAVTGALVSTDLGTAALNRAAQAIHIPACVGHVGAGAGFVNASNNGMVTCPASQTAATFVVPVLGLKAGYTITGFCLQGQIDSAGNVVTVDADLRKITVDAAGSTHASVGAITQISVTADTAIAAANSTKASLAEVVAAGENFYILVTATTGATTDIELNGAVVTVTEV